MERATGDCDAAGAGADCTGNSGGCVDGPDERDAFERGNGGGDICAGGFGGVAGFGAGVAFDCGSEPAAGGDYDNEPEGRFYECSLSGPGSGDGRSAAV